MAESVTVTLPTGTKVTCSKDLAEKLIPVEPKATAKKAASKKSEK